MPSGKRLPPARYALPLRLAAAIPLGTLFVGSGLVGPPGPAAAASDPAAPVLSFDPASAAVEPGETAETVLRIEPGDTEGTVCLYDLVLSHAGFTASGPHKATPPTTAGISGRPEKSAEVRASVAYTEVEEGAPCPEEPSELLKSSTQDAFAVTVAAESPDPSPTGSPDPSPTGSPDPSPTGSPDPSPTGSPDPSPTGSPDPSPTGSPDPSPTGSSDPSPSPTGSSPTSSSTGGSGNPGADGGPESDSDGESDGGGPSNGGSGGSGGGSGGSGGGSGGRGDPTAPPHSPVTTGDGSDYGAGGGADLPDLPTGAPDLPGLDSPSQDGPLADLPSVEPGERDSSGTTEVAAREQAATSMVTPAVLVLFLVLLLLFSTPLAPSRRVRIGPSTYKGRRRKH
ncbi:hypothetical protein GCM10023224_20070 [Streptomonospora halophila]|uniref:Uncharacterized protein n=1 Tax=Streptomonospora halophila TaxID=427369 RepID=A0ABP9GE21_9ACTN